MTTSTHPRTFGIAGTPKGDVLLYQPLLRIIANFVGPLSDLTLGLTLPFKSEPWGLIQQSLRGHKWLCPGSTGNSPLVHIISTLRKEKKNPEGEILAREANEDPNRPPGHPFLYDLWLVLRCPSSHALSISEENHHSLFSMSLLGTHSFLLWAMGEKLEAFRLANGETTPRAAGRRILSRRRDWNEYLYIHGFIPASLARLSPFEILTLCRWEEKRHLAIPLLRRGDFHNDEDMSEWYTKRGDPHTPYEFLVRGSRFETFLFISQHARLDLIFLVFSIRLNDPDGDCARIADLILFGKEFRGYERVMIDEMKDRMHEDEYCTCQPCYMIRLIREIYLPRVLPDEGFNPRNLNLVGVFPALKVLVESYLLVSGITRSYLFKSLMYYLGSGLKGARRGDSIDNMLFALSAGKKKEFISRFLGVTRKR